MLGIVKNMFLTDLLLYVTVSVVIHCELFGNCSNSYKILIANGFCRSKSYKLTSCQIWSFKKKCCRLARVKPHARGLGLSPGWFDHPQSLMDRNFATLQSKETQPRILCNRNGAISHLRTEMGFVEDFCYSLCDW